jgi:hypothetical protein
MDAFERGMRWFCTGRNAWVLWPVAIIAVVLAMAAAGMLNNLIAGTLLIVLPLAWLVGLLSVGTRERLNRSRAAGFQLMQELGVAAVWASLYTLPVWLLSNGIISLLWWSLVVYVETERRARTPRPETPGTE